MKEIIKKAFPITIPIMLGYVPLGIGFGLIMANAGYNALWAFLSSLSIYSGTGQYMAANFLSHGAQLLEIILIIVIMNSRMMFYGLSFLEKFGGMGWKKWYMIFSLTDETYAILCTVKTPEGIDEKKFMFCISMMNQSYWVLGSVIGALFGAVIRIDITGVDFIMTALFVVLCMDQWKRYKTHEAFWIGLSCSLVMLLIFGSKDFMIPALLGILASLIFRRKSIEKKLAAEEGDK
jgi:4-azaleucine resistance transporter AzlC